MVQVCCKKQLHVFVLLVSLLPSKRIASHRSDLLHPRRAVALCGIEGASQLLVTEVCWNPTPNRKGLLGMVRQWSHPPRCLGIFRATDPGCSLFSMSQSQAEVKLRGSQRNDAATLGIHAAPDHFAASGERRKSRRLQATGSDSEVGTVKKGQKKTGYLAGGATPRYSGRFHWKQCCLAKM